MKKNSFSPTPANPIHILVRLRDLPKESSVVNK